MRDLFAVVDAGGTLMGLSKTQGGAVKEAERMGAESIGFDDRFRDVDGAGLSPNPLTPKQAHRLMGNLRVNWNKLAKMSMEEAFERVVPYFSGKKYQQGKVRQVEAHQTPTGLAESFLGQNYKTSKTGAEVLGAPVDVLGLSLLPHRIWYDALGEQNGFAYTTLCAGSSPECRASCLVYSGQNATDMYNGVVKLSRTNALMSEPEAFAYLLTAALEWHVGARTKSNVNLARLNVFSDVPWELVCPEMLEHCADLFWARWGKQLKIKGPFYDYTKIPGRKPPACYDLTFSYSGRNVKETVSELGRGHRVAMVFVDFSKGSRRPEELPSQVRIQGSNYKVVDGDVHDARPFDPGGVVVGLKYKAPKAAGAKVRGRKHEKSFAKAYGEGFYGIRRAEAALHFPPSDERTNVFIVPVQETDDGSIVTPVIPRAQGGTEATNAGDTLKRGLKVFGQEDLEDTLLAMKR